MQKSVRSPLYSLIPKIVTLSVCSLLTLTIGCSKYTTGVISSLTDTANKSASATTPAEKFSQLDYSGSLSSGRYSAMQVLTLDKDKKEVVLQLPVPATGYLDHAQLSQTLTKFPGAILQLDPVSGGGSILTLHVPLAILVKDGSYANPVKLPNGKSIPGVSSGVLASTAVSLTSLTPITATVYLGLNVVGIYVTSPIDPFISLQTPILNADGTQNWGSLYTYPASTVGGKDGGFFISVVVPASISSIIADNL